MSVRIPTLAWVLSLMALATVLYWLAAIRLYGWLQPHVDVWLRRRLRRRMEKRAWREAARLWRS